MNAKNLTRNLTSRRQGRATNGGGIWIHNTYRRCWGSGLWINASHNNAVQD
ncbi:MAG: hypothetical protein RSG92_15395 [Pseudomonas sp.]